MCSSRSGVVGYRLDNSIGIQLESLTSLYLGVEVHDECDRGGRVFAFGHPLGALFKDEATGGFEGVCFGGLSVKNSGSGHLVDENFACV